MNGFDCKEAALPTIVAVLLDSSVVFLQELCRIRGYGPWADELHERLSIALKNQNFTGIPLEAEREQVEAGLRALDAVFSAVRQGTCHTTWDAGRD